MFARIRRLLGQFFNRSSTINNEPLNKVSLIVIILLDLFILSNVFWGLGDIGNRHLAPTEAYPCYSNWASYREERAQSKDYEIQDYNIVQRAFSIENYPYSPDPKQSVRQSYQASESGRWGQVSAVCLQYADQIDALKNKANQQTIAKIDKTQTQIGDLEQKNRQIRAEYDSTLLERIAGQPREQSINQVAAEKAKQQLEQNSQRITQLNQDISKLKAALLTKPEVAKFLAFLKNDTQFNELKSGYQQASFWYPTIQLVLQAAFLLPLIAVALAIHRFAQRKGYGLIALISWHLLVIFMIPLIIKVFEFLQIGVILQTLTRFINAILGGLLFLVSYVYILLIPLLGFGIIKFFQAVIFNPKVQAISRAQKSRCLKCAKRIRQQDQHCPYCGYDQYLECPNCHTMTYKHLPYCKACGHTQDLSHMH
jgi:primosomal protein N''